jgi:PAS domain S-box-containing protein
MTQKAGPGGGQSATISDGAGPRLRLLLRVPSEFGVRYFYSASTLAYFWGAGRVSPGLLSLSQLTGLILSYMVLVALLQLVSRAQAVRVRTSRALLLCDALVLIVAVPHDPAPSMALAFLVGLAVLDYGLRYGPELYRQGYAAGMLALAAATGIRAACVPGGINATTIWVLFLCMGAGFYIMLWTDARARADAAADQARRRTAMAMSVTGLGLWENDLLTGQLVLDQNAAAIHGAPAAPCRLSYQELDGLMSSTEADRVRATGVRALKERVPYDIEYDVVWPDKTVHSVGARGQPMYDEEGRPLRILGVCWDSTAQRHDREELSESKRQLALALEATGAGIWMMELATRRVHWDQHTCRIMGVDPATHAPNFEDFILRVHPEDRDLMARTFDRAVQQGEAQDVEVRILWPDGSQRLLRTRGQLADGGKSPSHLMGACWDITARRREQDQLRRITERNMRQGNALRVGTWKIDWIAQHVQRDSGMLEILGLGPEEKEEKLAIATQRYHPDDRPRLANLQEQIEAGQDELSFEYRMAAGDGSWRMLYSRGRVLRDGEGRPIGMIGATTDVTRLMNAGRGELSGLPPAST